MTVKKKLAKKAKTATPPDELATIRCGTTSGDITIRMNRAWSPNGYDRAVALFEQGFYDSTHFFRVVKNFLVQFGITYSTDPDLKAFAKSQIKDDPQLEPRIPFEPGTISFAGGGPNSRTSQLFIAYVSASSFGKELWETPIGKVIVGMDSVNSFYSGYGDMPPWGKGPQQGLIHSKGRKYMEKEYPLSDKFLKCKVVRHGEGETSKIPKEWLQETTSKKSSKKKLKEKHHDTKSQKKVRGAKEKLHIHHHKNMTLSGRIHDQRALAGGGTAWTDEGSILVGMLGLTIVLIVFVLIRNRRQKESKSL